MSSAAVMSAKINIQKQNNNETLPSTVVPSPLVSNVDLKWWYASPQALIDSDTFNGSSGKCDAAPLDQGFVNSQNYSIPEDECVPLFSGLSPDCVYWGPVSTSGVDNRTLCIQPGNQSYQYPVCAYENGSSKPIVKASNIRSVTGEEVMKREISANGPIVCPLNFYQFTSDSSTHAMWTLLRGGQYTRYVSEGFVARPEMDGTEYTKLAKGGWHAMACFGYGVSGTGVPYWECQNSWGQGWGASGTIKIERGIDAWNIESGCFTADVTLVN